MKRLALTFVVFLFCTGMTVEEVPNPQTAAGLYVQDSAAVLGPEYVSMIDSVCRDLEQKTSAEIAVVTVDDLGELVVEDFAEQLFKKYGIGKKGKDNGILILFARDDRKVKIEVGYGLEGVMPDAKAGRLLDVYAVPWFKQGLFGRGLFMTTLRTAEEIAQAEKMELGIQEPAAWPVQVVVPPPQPKPIGVRIARQVRESKPIGFYLAGALAFTLLAILLQVARITLSRARATKEKALGGGMVVPIAVWAVGGIGAIIFIVLTEVFVLPIIGYLLGGTVCTFLHVASRKYFRNYIKAYRLNCPKCRQPMQIVGEVADDALLTPEEIAEERAKGMDYEFWKCGPCDHMERLEVKLGGADKCNKCKRRTLKTTSTTLKAATSNNSGKEKVSYDCQNPKCRYHREIVRTIPKLSPPSSSSSSSRGGGSSSSFGGGSSGGGGASRSW